MSGIGKFDRRTALKLFAVATALAVIVGVVSSQQARPAAASVFASQTKADPKKAQAAFLEASKVFFSPRCTNCHTAGDVPTQGSMATPHAEGIARGKEGKGLEGISCVDCHLDKNTDGEGMPPGVPNWRMPPGDMKMIFQGRTPAQLCRQLKDPKQNGGKSKLTDAVHHMEADPLVLWAWSPGNDRTVPLLSHKDFMDIMKIWTDNGGACPD